MEKCTFFIFCFNVLTSSDNPGPEGREVWKSAPWQVAQVIRNDDTTDMGCRLSLTSGDNRLDFEAFFIAGAIKASLPEHALADGPITVSLLDPETGAGMRSMSANMATGSLVGELPGMGLPDFVLNWSQAGGGMIELRELPSAKLLMRWEATGFQAAAEQFSNCYNSMF